MNGEKEIIGAVLSQFPGARGHLNRFFESDAELLEPPAGKLLFTTDEFSPEDFFMDEDPELLGWNLACCTISDVLASGGDPAYYAHALTLSSAWDRDYVVRFSKGIAGALERAGAGFIGGDLGLAPRWKYTGICLGSAVSPVTRRGAGAGDRIYMTGRVGAGNLMAAHRLFAGGTEQLLPGTTAGIRFAMRTEEARIMRLHATSCIDTSDGVLNALNTIADINGLGYSVASLPYLEEGVVLCHAIGRPGTFLFAGECGEYELLFTINRDSEKEFLNQTRTSKLQFAYLGAMTEAPGRYLEEGGKVLRLNDFNISARGYDRIEDYLNDLTKFIFHAKGPA